MELNKETIKKIRGLVLFTVFVVVAGVNYRSLFSIGGTLLGISFPFLLGAAIAFILNVPMRRIEKIIPLKEHNRLKRPVSLSLTILFVLGIFCIFIFVMLPQISITLDSLKKSIPVFAIRVQEGLKTIFMENPTIISYISSINIDWKTTIEGIVNFLSIGAGSVLNSTFTAAMFIVSGVTTFGIAFIFSIYILLQKENLGRQFAKLARAFLPEKVTSPMFRIMELTERTFSHFLTGQCVEAVILGTMFFITMQIFGMDYALLIGVLIAFTALIPVFGAFIGCFIGVFLMLLISPRDAVEFAILFFVLQQLEGNLIYPHVVGNSVGLPSIWVLVAVTIGGSALGIVGMLIFIPLSSVFYTILRAAVNERLRIRKRSTAARQKTVKGGGA